MNPCNPDFYFKEQSCVSTLFLLYIIYVIKNSRMVNYLSLLKDGGFFLKVFSNVMQTHDQSVLSDKSPLACRGNG